MLLYALYLFKRKKKILDEKKMYLLQKTKIKRTTADMDDNGKKKFEACVI